jgi:hypothetical protein
VSGPLDEEIWGVQPTLPRPADVFGQDRPRRRAPLLARPETHGQRAAAEALVRAAEEAAPVVSTARQLEHLQRVSEVRDPEVLRRDFEKARTLNQRLKQSRTNVARAVAAAGRTGDRALIERAAKAYEQAARPDTEPAPRPLWQRALSGLGYALDTPHAQLRGLTTPGHDYFAERVPAETWHRELGKPDAGGAAGTVYRGIRGAAQRTPLAAAVGAAGGATALLMNVAGDAASGRLKTAREYRAEAEAAGRYFHDATSKLLTEAITDPTSYLTVGAGSAVKNASTAALRSATRAGVSRTVAKGLADEVGQAVARLGNTPELATEVRRLYGSALGPQGPALAEQAFGRNLEFLGRGQLRVAVPFAEQVGVDVLPNVARAEYPVGKAAQRLAGRDFFQTGLNVSPNVALMRGRLGEQAEAEVRHAQALQKELGRGRLERFVDINRRAGQAGVTKARQKELVEGFIDPDFQMVPIDTARAAGITPHPHNMVPHGPPDAEGFRDWYVVGRKPGAFYTRPANPAEQRFVDELDEVLQEIGDALVSKDIIRGKAINPLSRRYFPRQYAFDADAVGADVVLAEGGRGSGLRGFARSRETTPDVFQGQVYRRPGGVPLGQQDVPDFIKRADIHDALVRYSKATSLTEASQALEHAMARRFGRPITGPRWRLDKQEKIVTVGDQRYAVPAKVANMVDTTFDRAGGAIRDFIAGPLRTTQAGRAALKGIDGVSRLLSSWKQSVLLTRPAFFILNYFDDTMRMVAAGVTNPAPWVFRAMRARAGRGTSQEAAWLAEAQQQNIAMFRTDAMLDVDPMQMGRRLAKQMRRDADLSSPNFILKIWEKVLDTGGGWASAWEANSKLAMYMAMRARGEAPRMAAKRTFDALLNYEAPGRAIPLLRAFFPFASFMFRSPKAVTRQLLQRPGRVANIRRLPEVFGQETTEAPTLVQEQGQPIELHPGAAAIAGGLRKIAGGLTPNPVHGAQPGVRYTVSPRLSFDSSLAPFAAAAGGNWKPLTQSLNPLMVAGAEVALEEDLQRRQPMRGPQLSRPFAYGTPFVPTSLQADIDQAPWAARYVLPLVPPTSSPMFNHALNLVAQHTLGEQAPTSVIARPRNRANAPGDLFAQQVLGSLLPWRAWESYPYSGLADAAYDPRARTLQQALREYNRRIEQR